MPKHLDSTTMISTAVLGTSLLFSGCQWAHERSDLRNKDVVESERAVEGANNLSGGFYDDRYTGDDWFYDFYDLTPPRSAAASDGHRADPAALNNVDAAESAHRTTGIEGNGRMLYQRYYNEPWFYQRQEPEFGMPATPTRDPRIVSGHAAHGESIVGQIQRLKQIRNRTSGGQNLIVELKTTSGVRSIADLGPVRPLADLALTEGDTIRVVGHRENVGRYSVWMADRVNAGVNTVRLHRSKDVAEDEPRQLSGRIEQFRDVRVRDTGILHRTGSVRTPDGRIALVDFGPADANNIPPSAAAGEPLTVTGRVVRVGQYPVLMADHLSYDGGQSVLVARTDEPARMNAGRFNPARKGEPSSGLPTNDATCIGGGCETPDGIRMREPASNAMDGTVRGTQQ